MNALKIELAIVTNEVTELIERVVNLKMQLKENFNGKSKSILDISNNMMTTSTKLKKNNRFRKFMKEELTDKEIMAIIRNIALIVPMFLYQRSKGML